MPINTKLSPHTGCPLPSMALSSCLTFSVTSQTLGYGTSYSIIIMHITTNMFTLYTHTHVYMSAAVFHVQGICQKVTPAWNDVP